MSNIIKNKDDLMLVKDLFNLYRKENMNVGLLEDIIKELIPKDKNGELLVGYRLYEFGGGISAFSLSDNFLNLSIKEMYEWIDINSKKQIEIFNIRNIDLFKDYFFFYIMCHEIEHSYQYLMAYDAVESPCGLVRDGYKLIIDALTCRNYDQMSKIKVMRNFILHHLYYKNSHRYVMERNANVEAFDLLQMLATLNCDDEFVKIFNGMRNSFAMWGYIKDNNGSFLETCNNILLGYEYKKLNHDYQLSDIEKFRYGLPISKEYRNEIVRILKK